MQRKINFNAGPAALPDEVLAQAAAAVKEYKNTGLSVLELPHRGTHFLEIIEESKALVKKLCALGNDYEVLWMHGGGRMQFCMVPMNFLGEHDSAGYIDSGHWAEEALEYATHYGNVQILATSKKSNYNSLPEWPVSVSEGLSYIHFTTNNTIFGTQWHKVPKTKVPLIADMSSDIFSRKHDYKKYSLFYAAAQKNLGVAGVGLVVVRKDMLPCITRSLPPMLSYKAQVKENSILNTANVFGVYVSLLMLRWIDKKGIGAIEKDNKRKAQLLYNAIDNSKLFIPHVKKESHRSLMNVCFTAKSPKVEKAFIELCEKNYITGIKGHRSVGGFRASLYNCITVGAVEQLVQLMHEFEATIKNK
ncbi:MAG: phosphoserine transaminase [Flavipsychrobacter sp.]|jgi:phosphoserine aminotransferase|nr:phosphoserine transaminase [Flavipsychrobacter sp.]